MKIEALSGKAPINKAVAYSLLIISACTHLLLPAQAVVPATKPASIHPQAISAQAGHAISQYDMELLKADLDVGRQYIQAGQADKARAAYLHGLTSAQKQLPANHPLIGLFLVHLSATYMLDQNFDKACSLLSQGIGIINRTPAMQAHAEKLKGLEILLTSFLSGISALKEQNYPLAEEKFKASLKLGQQVGEPTIISISLSSIGLAQVMQDNTQEGEQSLNQALQFAEANHLKDAKAMALLAQEQLYSRRGDIPMAKQKFDEALGVGDTLFTRLQITKNLIEQEHQRLGMIEQALSAAQTPISAPDYFPDALYHRKVIRWNSQAQPIKVYIASGEQIPGWKPEFVDQFKQACLIWQRILNNRVQFEFTTDPNQNVDTSVSWTGDYGDRAGLTHLKFLSSRLLQTDIQFNLGTLDHQLYDTKTVYKLALHEVGHLLGIFGHSKNPQDIMFPTVTFTSAPSTRDVATIQQIYDHTADISNPAGITLDEYRKAHWPGPQKMPVEMLDHF